ncbi:hypothetical protein RCL1_001339 [Eukaryota sp. TZLM3-RCL]
MFVYNRFVQIGRIALVNFGEHTGKLAIVVDVLDGNRVVLEGINERHDIIRQPFSLKRVSLTDFVVNVPRGIRSGLLRKAIAEANIEEKFNNSARGKKLLRREARQSMNDFGRFQLMIAKKTLNLKANTIFNNLKKSAKL